MFEALATPEVVTGLLAENARLRAALAKATYEATHDVLTGLSNRADLPRAEQVVHQAIDRGDTVVVAVLDLIGFKRINDHHGHATGDAVLVEFARRLTAVTSPGEMALRLGGDEFVLVLFGGAGIGERLCAIRNHLTRPIVVNDRVLVAVPRMGVSLATHAPVMALIAQADTAMYRSRKSPVASHTICASEHVRTAALTAAACCETSEYLAASSVGDPLGQGIPGEEVLHEVAAGLATAAQLGGPRLDSIRDGTGTDPTDRRVRVHEQDAAGEEDLAHMDDYRFPLQRAG